jgi:ABC-type multidrug transport system fused ATPase/permease subunit
MRTFQRIAALFSSKERRRGYLLLGMILLMAFLDTVGVASIMPFMAVLGNPDVVESNKWLAWTYHGLGFADPMAFLFFLGGMVFIALVVSISFKALTQYALLRFTHMRNHSLSSRLFQGFLGRPYAWFLNRHSADLGKSVLSEVGQVIGGVIIPAMQLLAHGVVALFLIALLVAVDPVLAVSITLVLGGAYVFIYLTIRRYLARIGKDRVAANKERFQVAQEALGGIKEVKVFGRERAFYAQFLKPSLRFAQHQANNAILSQMPRYLLELIAFGGVLLVALYLMRAHGDFQQMLPVLALYAFAGYRLLPALNNVYGELTKLRFSLPALDVLYDDIQEIRANVKTVTGSDPAPLEVAVGISLENITFSYPKADKPALNNLSLHIPAKSTIALVGVTGSGKTTAVDLILGLLEPDTGRMLVDGRAIFESEIVDRKSENFPVEQKDIVRKWQRALGYVPQQIYLADDTVAANIAFGIPEEEIDMGAVIRAANIAELHGFVDKELPNGYQTLVGERGVRLSGGQRQRIGIARALYHDPAVLIFDEATSALDNLTEQAVMNAVNNLGSAKTIILVAHRLTTVKSCDCIYVLEHGTVVGKGSYKSLYAGNLRFQRLVQGINAEN